MSATTGVALVAGAAVEETLAIAGAVKLADTVCAGPAIAGTLAVVGMAAIGTFMVGIPAPPTVPSIFAVPTIGVTSTDKLWACATPGRAARVAATSTAPAASILAHCLSTELKVFPPYIKGVFPDLLPRGPRGESGSKNRPGTPLIRRTSSKEDLSGLLDGRQEGRVRPKILGAS